MEKEIIVLANSWRTGGRCIAGICKKTDEWIRPIYEDKSTQNAIPLEECDHINLLDTIKINLESKRPDRLYQRENYFINPAQRGEKWEKIDNGMSNAEKIEYIKRFCQPTGEILHSFGGYTPTKKIEKMAVENRESLILTDKYVTFTKRTGEYSVGKDGKPRWQGSFYYEPEKELKLSVTDPEFKEKLNKDSRTISGNYIMTISLAEPFRNNPNRCYKLIAGVIDPELF